MFLRPSRLVILCVAAAPALVMAEQLPRTPFISDASRQAVWYHPPGYPTSGCVSFTYGPRGVAREIWQKEAFSCRHQMLERARRASDLHTQIAALGELGFGFKGRNPEKARRHTREALALAEQLGKGCWVSALYRQYASMPGILPRLDLYRLAARAARQGGCPAEQALGLMGHGNLLPEDDRSAVDVLAAAVDQARRSREDEVLKRVLTQLARRQVSLRDHRAIHHLEEVVALHRAIGDRRREMHATWNVGVAYVLLGEAASGIPFLEEYLVYQRESGHPDEWAQRNLDRLRETGGF